MSKDLFYEMQEKSIHENIERVKNGEIESFETYAYLDKIEKFAKNAKSQIKDILIENSKNYLEGNSKEFKKGNIKFTIKSGSTRYSYKNITKWQDQNIKLKAIEAQSKQAFIAKQKNILTATEDGEVIEFPEVSYTADSVSVKFL